MEARGSKHQVLDLLNYSRNYSRVAMTQVEVHRLAGEIEILLSVNCPNLCTFAASKRGKV